MIFNWLFHVFSALVQQQIWSWNKKEHLWLNHREGEQLGRKEQLPQADQASEKWSERRRLWDYFPLLNKSESEVAQLCRLCDPMDSSLHQAPLSMRFFKARVLEWVAISFSRESSQPRDRTQVSHIVDRQFTIWATREVHIIVIWVQFFCIFFW